MTELSLRERQKRRTYNEIIDSTLKLIVERGYDNITMQMIADESAVGIATVFRYFETKAGVLAAIIRRDLNMIFMDSNEIVANPESSAEKTIKKLLLKNFSILEMPAKELLSRQLDYFSYNARRSELVTEVIVWAIKSLKDKIRAILKYHRKNGTFDSTHSLEDFVNIIYAVFNHHYIRCIQFNDNYEDQRKKLERRITILFKKWS